jgi:tripartite ATP-independent transporter DctM subunit
MIGLTAALIGLFTFLFLIGLPVAFSLGISGLISLAFMEGGIEKVNFTILAQRIFYGPNSFLILAIPFFLLAGKLMNTGGITERIYLFARSLVGHFKGGLGHVNVVASMIFAGMTGVATSEAAGLGVVEIKAMKDAGYDEDFAVAVAASSSTMGPIIPPSVALVVYGVLASTSVGRLLIGGVVPGVMTGIALMITVYIFAIHRGYPRDVKSNFREMRTRFGRAVWPMMTPVILIGGMLAGIFTPTEAAGVAVLYAFVLGCLVYREIRFADLRRILRETAVETAVITFIVSCAMLYGWIMIRSQIPVKLAEYLMSLTTNPVVMLMILNVFFLIVGCFMETLAAMTILVPILIPMIHKLGIDPVHFGLVMVFNLVIGLLTPPFGLVLFVMARISGVPLPRIVRAVAPFYIPLFAVLLLITFYKPFVTFLPDLLMGRPR